MFRSQRREIVIPQLEHARLSAAFAENWGNEIFSRPPIDFDSFIIGVATHDRGYDPLDNDPIMEVPEERWLEIQRRGSLMDSGNYIVELVVNLQLKRLLGYNMNPGRVPLVNQLEEQINQLVHVSGANRADFEWTDRITNLADSFSFDFCFELEKEGRAVVFADKRCLPGEISYRIEKDGGVRFDPWPLAVPEVSGHITGYQAAGYPEKLDPVEVPYRFHG